MASCHIYSCRARWRQFRVDVITSKHIKAFYSNYNWQSDTCTHVFAPCVNWSRDKRRSLIYFGRLGGFFFPTKCSRFEPLASRAASSRPSAPSRRRPLENGGKAGAQAQIAGRSRTCWLSLAITSICKCSTSTLSRVIFVLCLLFLPLLAPG